MLFFKTNNILYMNNLNSILFKDINKLNSFFLQGYNVIKLLFSSYLLFSLIFFLISRLLIKRLLLIFINILTLLILILRAAG